MAPSPGPRDARWQNGVPSAGFPQRPSKRVRPKTQPAPGAGKGGTPTMAENPDHRCCKCVHWVHGVCRMTREMKKNTICNCGKFQERK